MRYILFFLLVSTSLFAQTSRLPLKPLGAAVTGKRILLKTTTATVTGKRLGLTVTYSTVLVLPFAARTSAGVFTNAGVLVCNLWSNQVKQAGTVDPGWNGLDNQGNAVPAGNYVIKLLYNNVAYQWMGTLGNSSFDINNQSTMHRGFKRIRSMWFEGSRGFYGNGYAEGHPAQAYFLTSAVQKRVEFLRDSKTGQATVLTTSDGTNVYWAGYDLFSDNKRLNWIFATKVSDNSLVSFSSGVSVSTAQGQPYGETYPSSIDTVAGRLPANTSVYTGLAVQRSGNYLFASHGVRNRVQVINKTTGALVQSLAITSPGALAIDRGNDNVLWVVSGTSVTKRTINSDGTLSAATLTLPNLGKPMALAVSPDGATVAVCDGDTAGRVKGYSTSSGSLSWILGQKGGYYNSPVVSTGKFYFDDVSGGINDTFVAFQSDGSLWVGDNGNYRSLHFSASRAYVEQIAYLENCYTTSVDQNDATRLFAQYLEFSVSDYDSPATGWSLVRNYRATVPAEYFENEYNRLQNIFITGVFTDAATVSGHTYALLQRFTDKQWAVVELMPNAPLRFTGKLLPNGNWVMFKDGSLGVQYINDPRTLSTWNKQTLTSIDGSGNPVYSAAAAVASAPLTPNAPYDFSGFGDRFGFTSTGQLVTFFPGLFNASTGAGLGNHLGGVKNNNWLWQGHPATYRAYEGDYPSDDAYDVGNGVNYAGGNVSIVDRSIYPTYHGENWKNGQVNKFAHFYDNGLLVGLFGVTQAEAAADPITYRGMAGNVFGATGVAAPNGNHYLVHGEEFGWSGLHIWRISNLGSIAELSVPATVSVQTDPRGLPMFTGLTRNTSLIDGQNGIRRSPATDDGEYRVRSSVYRYKKREPTDLYVQNNGTTGVKSVTATLPGSYSGLSGWQMQFTLDASKYYINRGSYLEAGSGGVYTQILDRAGKVLVRYEQKADGDNVRLLVNGTLIKTGKYFGGNTLIPSVPIKIVAAGSSITFTYGSYAPVTVAPFESGADNSSPAAINVFHWIDADGGQNSGRIVDIADGYYKPIP